MKVTRSNHMGVTGFAKLGVNKLLILGFGISIVSSVVIGLIAWRSLTGISANVEDIAEKAQFVNDGMVEVAGNTRQASEGTKLIIGNMEREILPATKSSVQDMATIEGTFKDILNSIAELSGVAQNANDGMINVANTTRVASGNAKQIVSNVENVILPITESSVQDMDIIEETFEEIVDNLSALVEQEGLDVDTFIFEAEDILESVKRESLPLLRTVKGNIQEGEDQIYDMKNSLVKFNYRLGMYVKFVEQLSAKISDVIFKTGNVMKVVEEKSMPLVRTVKANTEAGEIKMYTMKDSLIDFDSRLGMFVEKSEEAANAANMINEEALKSFENVKTTKATMSILVLAVVGLITGFSVIIRNAISKPINKAIDSLNEASLQTAASSDQISQSSHSLAQGASEQASSIEETSASMEEMLSMTKQNANNADEAAKLASLCSLTAESGNRAVNDMDGAMQAINESNKKISEIIKVIDGIAFQTNLLALNAAVEAARAGEHGKGFAVVAEEVRNLAQRSAAAAKDTAALIEDSVNKTETGTKLSEKCKEVLNGIVLNVKKVTDLTNEISAASQEQSKGVEQVTSAVQEMDSVVQQNAASAEETASASEEMSAQAQTMKEQIRMLSLHVGNRKNGKSRASSEKLEEDFGYSPSLTEHQISQTSDRSNDNGAKFRLRKNLGDTVNRARNLKDLSYDISNESVMGHSDEINSV